MTIHRRTLLAAAPALAIAGPAFSWPAFIEPAPAPIRAYERKTNGRVGLYAENLHTGKKLTWRSGERFVMCSTFKASLAACVLSRVDMGQERLDRMVSYGEKDLLDYAPVAKAKDNLARGALSIEALCKGAVELSDNTCANLLLSAGGGPAALTNFWRTTGDGASRLDANEPELNRSQPGDPHNTTTPAAMAGNLKRLVIGSMLLPPSRERLTNWMLDCQTGANRLRAGLPKAWSVADKTGNNGKDAAGDIAVAWIKPGEPVLICAYTQGGSPRPDDHETLFAGIGKVVGERLRA
ncbi:MAG: class A beta-lactamase [Caulobacteraceae bacterium]